MIASLVQHTSETRESLMRYTLPELEGLSVALNENNKMETKDDNEFIDSESVTGADAVRGLLSSGFAQ